ncbi:MAG: 6-bladed beta-propeller [Desulfobacterales bacterium]
MNNRNHGWHIFAVILAVILLLEPAACIKDTRVAKEPLPDIVWPKPPEIPRIRFIAAVSKPRDLQIRPGLFKRIFDYMTGKTEVPMVAPYGVETDSAGRLYVVDTFLRTVHVFDVKGSTYYLFPSDKANLVSPIDIAIENTRGNIYVSDSQGGAVKIFKDAGKRFAGEIGKGLLGRPTGIAVNQKTSELLVVDTQNASILRFDLADHKLQGKFGGSGTAQGELNFPTNIYVNSDGIIFASDSLNFRIQEFTPDGKFLRAFGSIGSGPGHFSRPKGVAVDSDGNIYVVDGLFDNIQIFDRESRLLMAFGRPGNGYGEFWLPTGIFIDRDDRIYVSDTYNKRVQIFQYLKGDFTSK